MLEDMYKHKVHHSESHPIVPRTSVGTSPAPSTHPTRVQSHLRLWADTKNSIQCNPAQDPKATICVVCLASVASQACTSSSTEPPPYLLNYVDARMRSRGRVQQRICQ